MTIDQIIKNIAQLEYSLFVVNSYAAGIQQNDGRYITKYFPMSPFVIEQMLKRQGSMGCYQQGYKTNRIKWICFDFDCKDKVEPNVLSLYNQCIVPFIQMLDEFEINYMLEFSGRRGIHVWITFDKLIAKELGYRIVCKLEQCCPALYGIMESKEWGLDRFPATDSSRNNIVASDPIGQTILVNSMPVMIVGVLDIIDSPFMRSENLYVYMPYTSVMSRLYKQNYLSSIVVRIQDGFSTAVAERSIINLLISRHGRQDFFIQSSDTIMKSITSTTLTFTLLISAIAVISLVVGGIGVMNIMLVSVTERTREIGIRMAVGARQSDIMAQFLIEAVMVCLLGGAVGVIMSFGVGQLLSSLSESITMSFSLDSIIAAVLTSSAIGIGFGFMPARSAARLNPIEALARE